MVVFYSDERVQNELWVQERGKNIDKGSMRAEVKRGNRMCGSPRSLQGAPHASARVTPRFCSGLFAPFQSRENFNQHQTRLRSAQAWPGCCLVTRPGPSMEDLGQSGAGGTRGSLPTHVQAPRPCLHPELLGPLCTKERGGTGGFTEVRSRTQGPRISDPLGGDWQLGRKQSPGAALSPWCV